MKLREGSLFSGYNGLGMAVSEVFGSEPAWFSEIEPGPSKILAHHWPEVPNLGDLTAIDWDAVEPVDILSGGFPCQDVSAAGKRAGLHPDTRSGLWNHMAYAISKLRPQYVVAENVRGLLSAEAHSDVEPCPWCLGEGSGEPDLRALGAVLGDLAELGYDAQWCGLRAADVGAPHGRYRIFVLAVDAASPGLQGATSGRIQYSLSGSGRGGSATDPSGEGLQESEGIARGLQSELPATGRAGGLAADAASGGADAAEQPRLTQGTVARSDSATDAEHGNQSERTRPTWRQEGQRASVGQRSGLSGGGVDAAERSASPAAWGQYGPAIERWERVLGRVAPAPTEPGAKGGQRLAPRFVEWMQGLPAGHVTDVPGVNRNAQLKALGNGVVPQQAAAALHHLAGAA